MRRLNPNAAPFVPKTAQIIPDLIPADAWDRIETSTFVTNEQVEPTPTRYLYECPLTPDEIRVRVVRRTWLMEKMQAIQKQRREEQRQALEKKERMPQHCSTLQHIDALINQYSADQKEPDLTLDKSELPVAIAPIMFDENNGVYKQVCYWLKNLDPKYYEVPSIKDLRAIHSLKKTKYAEWAGALKRMNIIDTARYGDLKKMLDGARLYISNEDYATYLLKINAFKRANTNRHTNVFNKIGINVRYLTTLLIQKYRYALACIKRVERVMPMTREECEVVLVKPSEWRLPDILCTLPITMILFLHSGVYRNEFVRVGEEHRVANGLRDVDAAYIQSYACDVYLRSVRGDAFQRKLLYELVFVQLQAYK